ncbi:hypothetical protein IFM89_019371 [Coptis chinensis]|uniref:Uncharacterized protein n=1 Tax=Coptis chinensis TaxID=261450 RepID=A0A835M001_9MAGN|nr:hypothetical protein IFM89_019371 [Coptis chinensis]
MKVPYTVDVLERCQISPPNNMSPTHIFRLWLPIPLVQHLFFFEFHHPNTYFLDTVLPNLKKSLSLTLQHFFYFAGNLTWLQDSAKPEILYVDNDSVRFTVVESYYDFDKLVTNHIKEANEFHPLVPKLLIQSSDNHVPLLALQVTLFPDKGICIGITFNRSCGCGW